jgi:alanine racemase
MRPTVAEIDLGAIAFNFRQVQERVKPARVMAVVKANAYGHGAVPVARKVLKCGAAYLAVAMVEEAAELREAGIEAPILVFGGFTGDEIPEYVRLGLEATVFSHEHLQWLGETLPGSGNRLRVHVKVDTGMHRVGVSYSEAPEFIARLIRIEGVELVGVYTHFATSDAEDKSFARLQLGRFRKVLEELKSRNIHVPLVHAANSGAILDLPETYFDMVRLGVSLYGYYPSEETSESLPLRPAMTLRSRVSFVKDVPAGIPVGYGCTYVTRKATRLATVPVGYADGYNRLLSNRGWVSIRGKTFPVAGRVSMDQIVVDLLGDPSIGAGDDVILFGPDVDPRVSVPYIARQLNTIPYEVTCWVSARVPRIYRDE